MPVKSHRAIAVASLPVCARDGSPPRVAAPATPHVAAFIEDVTPTVGRPTGPGFSPPASSAEHPLFAKGLVLEIADSRHVLYAMNWTDVQSSSHDPLRDENARRRGQPHHG